MKESVTRSGKPGNKGRLKSLMISTHLTILKVLVVLLAAVHPSDDQWKAARKLEELIEDDQIKTEGRFRDWAKKLFHLPPDLKMQVWLALSDKIDKSRWGELRHRNAEIERELERELQERLEHLGRWKR
jgi:hypothetical protein